MLVKMKDIDYSDYTGNGDYSWFIEIALNNKKKISEMVEAAQEAAWESGDGVRIELAELLDRTGVSYNIVEPDMVIEI